MRIQRILIASLCATVLVAVVLIGAVIYWQRQAPVFKDPAKLIFAVRAYEQDLNKRGQTWPATVSLAELVKGGYIAADDVRALESTEVTLCLTIDNNDPRAVLMYARVPDGGVMALLGDGSVQQLTSQRIEDYFKTTSTDLRTLQGFWNGQEIGIMGAPSLKVDGAKVEFRGANTNEWYQAKFSLREDAVPRQLNVVVTNCPLSKYVGQTTHAIYKIESDTLTVTANEPGNPDVPGGFDAPHAHQFVFKK